MGQHFKPHPHARQRRRRSTDIWSATLTVAEFTIEPNTYRGYTHVGTAVGELDPSTFSHDGDEITVNNLWHIVGGLLTFEISQELGGEGFLLRLGETLLPLGEPTGDPPVYRFSDHGVSWSVGDTVEVRLIPNHAATGAPVITGAPVVGETLTADTDGIGDPDGIDNADFSYQWIANDGTDDSDIEGATDSTYTLVFADYGNTIKVRVSFTDDNDFPESLTSTAVAVASPTTTSSTPPFSPWASEPFLAAIAATPTPETLNLPTSPTTAIRQWCKSWRTSGMSFTFRLRRHWVRGIMASSWTTRRYSLARPAEARRDTKSQTTA